MDAVRKFTSGILSLLDMPQRHRQTIITGLGIGALGDAVMKASPLRTVAALALASLASMTSLPASAQLNQCAIYADEMARERSAVIGSYSTYYEQYYANCVAQFVGGGGGVGSGGTSPGDFCMTHANCTVNPPPSCGQSGCQASQ